MEKAVGLGYRVLVQVVIPCRRLTVATGAATEGRRREGIFQEIISVDVVVHDQVVHGMVAETDNGSWLENLPSPPMVYKNEQYIPWRVDSVDGRRFTAMRRCSHWDIVP